MYVVHRLGIWIENCRHSFPHIYVMLYDNIIQLGKRHKLNH